MSPLISVPALPTSLPVLNMLDPMINAGTILCIDPAHSADPVAGVPASGSILPNLAWRQLAAMIGSGNRATLSPVLTYAGLSAPSGLIERSSKGGIHVICSQGNLAAGGGFALELPDVVKTQILTAVAAGHGIAMSRIRRVTRAATPASSVVRGAVLASKTSPGSNSLLSAYTNSGVGLAVSPAIGAAGSLGGTLISDTGANGELADAGANAWTGTVPAVANMYGGLYQGRLPDTTLNPSSNAQAHPSAILYRWIIEDLTVSGRAFADFTAANQAWFTTHVRTANGRYFGDTYTAPSTIP